MTDCRVLVVGCWMSGYCCMVYDPYQMILVLAHLIGVIII